MLVAHLSDLHLGRKSPGDPHGAERLNSFRQAVATLSSEQPDLIVIAGDVFDSPSVDHVIVEEAGKCLARAQNQHGQPIPVVIIPGNHDPADADKLWTAFKKSLPDSAAVHVPLVAELIELADGKLVVEAYPCPTRFSAEPPWEPRLPTTNDASALRVVVAHGTLQGGPVPEDETDAYPFTQADLERLNADYIALGHFHGVYPPLSEGEEGCRNYCYCGTHEPDQFTGDAGYAILATLTKGAPARLRRIKVGKRQWRLITIAQPADLAKIEQLRDQVEASSDPARFVVRLKVLAKMGWNGKDIDRLDRLESALRALGAEVERRGDVQARADAQALDLGELPSGAVREALLSLQGELALTEDAARQAVLTAALQVGWDKIKEAVT